MKTLLAGIAFALAMAFTSQAFATDLPDCPKGACGNKGTTSVETFKRTHNDQPPAANAATRHAIAVLLLGALVGLILWTPVLPWLFKWAGFN